ncbi:MAG: hypothetical protein N3A01_05405 [Bacteroidales bacterium]|nr:hypothetical protein [Bacteroidales bacterium]
MVKMLMFLINVLLIFSCSKIVTTNDVFVDNGIFYLKRDSSVFSGIIRDNYKNGLPKRVKSVKNGKLNGYVLSFYKNSRFSYIAKYHNNKKTDGYKMFYINGKIKEKLVKINSNKFLLYKYNEDGSIHSIYTIKDNIFNGPAFVYYPNGKIMSYINFVNNKKNGHFITYHPNGKKNLEGNFYNDSLHGKILMSDTSGIIISEQYYHRGIRKGRWKYYNHDSKIITWLVFQENGKVKEKIDSSFDGKIINKIKFN